MLSDCICENLRIGVVEGQWLSVDGKGRGDASRHSKYKLGAHATLRWDEEDIGSLHEKGACGLVAEEEIKVDFGWVR